MAKAKKLPSGKWRVQVFLGKDVDGKQIRRSITAPTKKEAEQKAALLAAQRNVTTSRMTIAQAIDRYIELNRLALSPATIVSYEAAKIKLGDFGALPISKVTDDAAQTFYKYPKNRTNTEKSVFMRFSLSFILQKFLSFYKNILYFKIGVHTKCTKKKPGINPSSLMIFLLLFPLCKPNYRLAFLSEIEACTPNRPMCPKSRTPKIFHQSTCISDALICLFCIPPFYSPFLFCLNQNSIR